MKILSTWGLVCLLTVPLFAQPPLQIKFVRDIPILPNQTAAKANFVAISVSAQGEIFLADAGLNRIVKIDSLGSLLKEIGGFGWQDAQFDGPVDLWALNGLDVFVADFNNSRLQRFDRQLNFIQSIVNDPNLDPGRQFAFPVAVAQSRFGELFIAERENRRILRFDRNIVPAQSFGDFDWGAGTLQEPSGIWVSARDEIFVSDIQRQAVIRFDYYGNFLQEIKHPSLIKPVSPVTKAGSIFVADVSSQRIVIFNPDGSHLVDFAATGNAAKENRPEDTKIDLGLWQNYLYILHSSSKQIHCYQITQNSR